MAIEKQLGELIMMLILWLMIIITFLPAISENALRIMRPEIFNERREHEKALNRMRRERDKALLEVTELKKKMNTFTYTQPKNDHNVYIKSKNDYQV